MGLYNGKGVDGFWNGNGDEGSGGRERVETADSSLRLRPIQRANIEIAAKFQ